MTPHTQSTKAENIATSEHGKDQHILQTKISMPEYREM